MRKCATALARGQIVARRRAFPLVFTSRLRPPRLVDSTKTPLQGGALGSSTAACRLRARGHAQWRSAGASARETRFAVVCKSRATARFVFCDFTQAATASERTPYEAHLELQVVALFATAICRGWLSESRSGGRHRFMFRLADCCLLGLMASRTPKLRE